MFVVCLTLLVGAISCSNDDFEVNAPYESKELSNAELIELALSRMPQTRGDAPFPVMMVTTKKTVTIKCGVAENVEINWGDGSTIPVVKNIINGYTHTYSDNQPSHGIFLKGSNQAITTLLVENNELIYLDVINNTELGFLACTGNKLAALDLTGCPNLLTLWAMRNNLSSIDVTHLPSLEALTLNDNQLTDIDVSKNLNLLSLFVGNNKITTLDLTKNTNLNCISLSGLSINTINNLPISNTSFSIFSKLKELDVSDTPFTSLDLSSNPLVFGIVISGTAITQLDISNLEIDYLDAVNSSLTNLKYTSNNLLYTYYLRIIDTPFEELSSNLYPLITALPDRNSPDEDGSVRQGNLCTSSSALIAPFLSYLTAKNWVISQ